MRELTSSEKAAEADSWKRWQQAWGNTESGAHAFGWANGYSARDAAVGQLSEDVRRLSIENERLRKALEWYADRSNYDENHAPLNRGLLSSYFDEGNRARHALGVE